jgi:hypothetical protein
VLGHSSRDQGSESLAHHRFQQSKLVGKVIVKCGPIQGRPLGDVLHCDSVEGLFGEQTLERLEEHLPGTADTRVELLPLNCHSINLLFDKGNVHRCIDNICRFDKQ